MSRLTQDGMAESVSRDQNLKREPGREKIIASDELITSRIVQVITIHTHSECGKDRRILIGSW